MDGFDDDADFNVREGEDLRAAANAVKLSVSNTHVEHDVGTAFRVRSSRSSLNPSPAPREDTEAILKWREQQRLRLEEKDRVEMESKLAMRAQAKRELEAWYSRHAEQVKALQAANRSASQAAERDFGASSAPIEPGTAWDRVAKLCDFNPKAARNTKDVSRLRSIILQLKQQETKQKQ